MKTEEINKHFKTSTPCCNFYKRKKEDMKQLRKLDVSLYKYWLKLLFVCFQKKKIHIKILWLCGISDIMQNIKFRDGQPERQVQEA